MKTQNVMLLALWIVVLSFAAGVLSTMLGINFPLTKPSNLDPPPPPYVWYRLNPEPSLTCLIVEAQYNVHPIAMWCERIAP